jgi:hypothetical protein
MMEFIEVELLNLEKYKPRKDQKRTQSFLIPADFATTEPWCALSGDEFILLGHIIGLAVSTNSPHVKLFQTGSASIKKCLGHLEKLEFIRSVPVTRTESVQNTSVTRTEVAQELDGPYHEISSKESLKYDFDLFANHYRKTFKNTSTGPKAFKRFEEQFGSNRDDIQILWAAVSNYQRMLSNEEWRKPKTSVETFLGSKKSGYFWRDFIEVVKVARPCGSMIPDDWEPEIGNNV